MHRLLIAVLSVAFSLPVLAEGYAQEAMAKRVDTTTALLLGWLELENTSKHRVLVEDHMRFSETPQKSKRLPNLYECGLIKRPDEPRYPLSYTVQYLGRLEEFTPLDGKTQVSEIWSVGKAQ
ncbi:hypothetical protein [Gallaecimonas xiamenensis]|uniref:Uncharacterized protein n=1 Tax=Gallaecimonas xiamenensis 3-C-1 TaxID=745411 RepID=K2JK60_9GAMM|nr:hypothetical protein [Gallaecimonas xiamenensis]EKE75658.1 hypothetical protein B3C1_06248 [Gallaecimonas xiamenensis 3-C-1]